MEHNNPNIWGAATRKAIYGFMQFIGSFIAFVPGRGGMGRVLRLARLLYVGIRARCACGGCAMPASRVACQYRVDKELHSYPNLSKTKPLSNGRRHEPAPTATQRPNQPQKDQDRSHLL